VLAGLLTLTAAPAPAQSSDPAATRAGLLEEAREALSRQSTPPERSAIERGLRWYDHQHVLTKVLGGWKGLHLAPTGFPAGAGIKVGLGYDRALNAAAADPRASNRASVSTAGGYSTNGYTRVGTRIDLANVGGSNIDVNIGGQFYEYPQEEFYGLGMTSTESAESNYLLDVVDAGVAVKWQASWLRLGGGLSYFAPRVGRGTASRSPSTSDLYTGAEAPGLGTHTDYIKAKVSAEIDRRDNPAHPHAGGRYALAVTRFDDRSSGQYDFQRLDASIHQYLPLPDRYRLLALRAEGVFTTADGDDAVPFYLQPTLGGASQLRGFRESRYRDQNSLLIGAEYRWEAWWALDTALFVDAGMVAPSRRSLSLRDMEVGYGIGFRFHSNRAFVARLDLAFSREGFVPLLRFEHVF
jgi:hypothetical protein